MMSAHEISQMLDGIGPALGDHLWQSTLVAGAAGLLTLMLRRQHARIRYWIWLAASVKFLIPFSLLMALGSHMAPAFPATQPALYITMEQVGQPFSRAAIGATGKLTTTAVPASAGHWLAELLITVWMCGFVAIISVWCLRWRRLSLAMRAGLPLTEGREVETLRRVESAAGIRRSVAVMLSRASVEPGVFGIAKPVLIWPYGISERLADDQLEAILAHEVWHVRRRDNLAAAVHMLVEAIFWFHPLVWWLGARLMHERERACDHEVLELGKDRQVYAESILKVCEFCLESPLACVAGVTGSDLKKRMVHIMTERLVRKLDFTRKLLLSMAAFAVIVVPILFGLVRPSQSRAQAQTTSSASPTFESVSIMRTEPEKQMTGLMFKPDEISATNVTLRMLIREAYRVQDNQISGGPDWINTEKFVIHARTEKPVALDKPGAGPGLPSRMLQTLLADRFKLSVHHVPKQDQVYALTVAESGSKLTPLDYKPATTKGGERTEVYSNIFVGKGEFSGHGVSMDSLVGYLSRRLGRPVLDKTGLTGTYVVTLKWPDDEKLAPLFDDAQGSSRPLAESSAPFIFTALEEQLGLKLAPEQTVVDSIVIDSVERPAEN